MSYILDALKKTEHEKARKQRGSGVVNISGELFAAELQQRPEGRSGIKTAILVVSAVVLACGATWMVLSPGKQTSVAVRPLPAPLDTGSAKELSPPVPVSAAAPPVLPQAVAPTYVASKAPETLRQVTALPAVKKNSPAPPVSNVARPPVAPVKQPSATTKTTVSGPASAGTAASEFDAAAVLTQQELARRLRDRKTNASALPSMSPPADIKLSGIAYQDDRRARRAVVNGYLLQEGSQVSGAVITDILQDRVRFSQGGRSFELGLVSLGSK